MPPNDAIFGFLEIGSSHLALDGRGSYDATAQSPQTMGELEDPLRSVKIDGDQEYEKLSTSAAVAHDWMDNKRETNQYRMPAHPEEESSFPGQVVAPRDGAPICSPDLHTIIEALQTQIDAQDKMIAFLQELQEVSYGSCLRRLTASLNACSLRSRPFIPASETDNWGTGIPEIFPIVAEPNLYAEVGLLNIVEARQTAPDIVRSSINRRFASSVLLIGSTANPPRGNETVEVLISHAGIPSSLYKLCGGGLVGYSNIGVFFEGPTGQRRQYLRLWCLIWGHQ